MKENKNEDFITIEETCQLTGLSKTTLANYRSQKVKLPFYKMGGSIWYKKSEILETINNSRVSVSKNSETQS